MAMEEERNLCPDCQERVPLGAPRCPHCGRRFHPGRNSWWALYTQSWLLWDKCSGRAPLLEFYAFAAPHTLLFLWSCFYVANRLGARPWEEGGWGNVSAAFDREPMLYLLFAFFALTLVPAFSLCCRRVHDSDRDTADMFEEGVEIAESFPRWLLLGDLVAYILSHVLAKIYFRMLGIVALLVHLPNLLIFEDSTPGPNRFGPATRYLRYQDGPMPRHPFN